MFPSIITPTSSIPFPCFTKIFTAPEHPSFGFCIAILDFPFYLSPHINHTSLCSSDHRSPFLLASAHQSFASLPFTQWLALSCPLKPTLFCGLLVRLPIPFFLPTFKLSSVHMPSGSCLPAVLPLISALILNNLVITPTTDCTGCNIFQIQFGY